MQQQHHKSKQHSTVVTVCSLQSKTVQPTLQFLGAGGEVAAGRLASWCRTAVSKHNQASSSKREQLVEGHTGSVAGRMSRGGQHPTP